MEQGREGVQHPLFRGPNLYIHKSVKSTMDMFCIIAPAVLLFLHLYF